MATLQHSLLATYKAVYFSLAQETDAVLYLDICQLHALFQEVVYKLLMYRFGYMLQISPILEAYKPSKEHG